MLFAIGIASALFILVPVFVFFLAFLGQYAKSFREAPPENSRLGSINCKSWADAGTLQPIFEQAANAYGIQPALLAAIFLSENGGNWTDKSPNWPISPSAAKGPFQFIESTWQGKYNNGYMRDGNGDGRKDINNIYDASYGAAAYLSDILTKDVHTTANTAKDEDIRSAAVAYNKGSRNMQIWRKIAGWWFDLIPNREARNYQANASKYFKELNTGCEASETIGSFAGCESNTGSTATGISKKPIVVLDPGHGTKDNKRTFGDSFEDRDNLAVAKKILPILEKNNIEVILTRKTIGEAISSQLPSVFPSSCTGAQGKEAIDNFRRAEMANANNADAILHIHSNAGTDKGYILFYPGEQGKINPGFGCGNVKGPIGSQVPARSLSLAKDLDSAMSTTIKSSGVRDTTKFPAYTSKGYGVYSYDAPLVSSAAVTVEMFGHEDTAYAENFYKNTGGAMDKMAEGIAKGLMSYLDSAPLNTKTESNRSKSCQIADFAIKTLFDVKQKDSGTKGKSMLQRLSDYAKGRVWSKDTDGYGHLFYADCGSFVGYVVRISGIDSKYPIAGSALQFKYLQSHPEKYQMFAATNTNLKPGDILFRGSCDSKGCHYAKRGKYGHTNIFIGGNKYFPGYTIASASLDDWGPRPEISRQSSMGVAVRIKN